MTLFTFEARAGSATVDGWPMDVLSGFIALQFVEAVGPEERAVYRDHFGEDYVLTREGPDEFVGDIRED